MHNATGDFISFIDSDDFIELNMYEILINAMKTTNADIVWCNYYHYFENSPCTPHKLFTKSKTYDLETDSNKFFSDLFNNYHMEAFVWNRLYKKDIFSKIRFPYGRRCEDGFILMSILSSAKKIHVITDYLYYYRQRQNSLSSKQQKNEQFELDFTESRLLRSIDYNYFMPNTIESNTLLYKSYKKALNYTLKINDDKYKSNLPILVDKLHKLFYTDISYKRKLSITYHLFYAYIYQIINKRNFIK